MESVGRNEFISDDEKAKADVCYKMFNFKNEYIKGKRANDLNYKYTSSEDVLRDAVDASREAVDSSNVVRITEEIKKKEEEGEEGEEEEEEEEEEEGYLNLWYSGGRKRKTLKSRKNKRTGRKLKTKNSRALV